MFGLQDFVNILNMITIISLVYGNFKQYKLIKELIDEICDLEEKLIRTKYE